MFLRYLACNLPDFHINSALLATLPFDTGHKKTDLKVFVVVVPKEGWVLGCAHPSFDMTKENIIYDARRVKF